MTKLMADILRQPEELSKTLNYTVGRGSSTLYEAAKIVRQARHLFITGIGSSWHAGMAVLSLCNSSDRPAYLYDACELLSYSRLPEQSAVIILSRSGKSHEIISLLSKFEGSGTKIIAVTNTPESPLSQAADVTLELHANFDHLVSVSMYSGLGLVGGLLASCAAASSGSLDDSLKFALNDSLLAAGKMIGRWRTQIVESDWFAPDAPTYFLARGGSLASSHETRLLWEEAAKAPASAMTTGGFRHGPQEIVRKDLRVGLWIDRNWMRDQDLALAADLRKLGARVMLIGQDLPEDAGDLVLSLPNTPNQWQFLIDIMPAQLAAEHLSRLRGEDCDSFTICSYIVESDGGLITAPPPNLR